MATFKNDLSLACSSVSRPHSVTFLRQRGQLSLIATRPSIAPLSNSTKADSSQRAKEVERRPARVIFTWELVVSEISTFLQGIALPFSRLSIAIVY